MWCVRPQHALSAFRCSLLTGRPLGEHYVRSSPWSTYGQAKPRQYTLRYALSSQQDCNKDACPTCLSHPQATQHGHKECVFKLPNMAGCSRLRAMPKGLARTAGRVN